LHPTKDLTEIREINIPLSRISTSARTRALVRRRTEKFSSAYTKILFSSWLVHNALAKPEEAHVPKRTIVVQWFCWGSKRRMEASSILEPTQRPFHVL